jgi:gliding motility-associated-like protein
MLQLLLLKFYKKMNRIIQCLIVGCFSLFTSLSVYAQSYASFTSKLEVCENDTIVFRSNSNVVGATIVEYAYDVDGDGTFDIKSSVDTTYTVYKKSDLETKYGGQHNFDVQLRIVTSKNDTLYSSKIGIKVNYLPVLTISNTVSFDTVACRLQKMQFFNNFYVSEGSIANTYWYFNNADETYTTTFFNRIFDKAGKYTVSILAVSDKYCKTRTEGSLRVKEIPSGVITYSGDTTFYNDKSVDLIVSGNFKTSVWNTTETTPKITVKNSGVYTVKLTNEENCSIDLKSSSINVLIEQPFSAMNTMTLNGDGKNDLWKIFEIEAYGKCKVKIFNSNGLIIYSNEDYKNDWDGLFDGNYVAEGTYYYTVEASELPEVQKGTINILH